MIFKRGQTVKVINTVEAEEILLGLTGTIDMVNWNNNRLQGIYVPKYKEYFLVHSNDIKVIK